MNPVEAILKEAGIRAKVSEGVAIVRLGQHSLEVSERGVRSLEPGCGRVRYVGKDGSLDINSTAAYLNACLNRIYS